MTSNNKLQRPAIKIYIDENIHNNQDIMNVCWGIEEEGIPYDKERHKGDALSLSYKAAIESNLGVGIGIDENKVVLHFHKLKKEEPLLVSSLWEDDIVLRSIGANGARLVKRIPLKIIERQEMIDDVVSNVMKKISAD